MRGRGQNETKDKHVKRVGKSVGRGMIGYIHIEVRQR